MTEPYDPRLTVTGEGDALVLVPGMNGSAELFYRQVPYLERCFRVATYTLRDDARSHDVLADDLASVIERVAPSQRRAIVAGESFGGTVALACAIRHPQRVAALVILNSFPFFSPQLRLRLAIAGITLLPWGAMPVVRRLTAFRLHSRHTHRAEIERFLELTARATRAGYLSRLKLLTRFDARAHLSDIRVPALFLASELDHLVPSVREARYMASRVPSSVMTVLAGHGHICLIAPDLDLAAIVREWLASG